MKLFDILTELDSGSKKTAPNIFNEPINCGFEAEFIWLGHFDERTFWEWGNINDITWTEVKDMLKKAGAGYMINGMESKFKVWFEYLEDDYNDPEYGGYNEDTAFSDFVESEYDGYYGRLIFVIHLAYKGETYPSETPEFDLEKKIYKEWIKPHSLVPDIGDVTAYDDEYEYDDEDEDEEYSNTDNSYWKFADERSIRTTFPGIGLGMEIISPVYENLNDMFTDMSSLFSWFNNNSVITNETTGLHMTMSLSEQGTEMNKLKLCTLAADSNILKRFDREENPNSTAIVKFIQHIVQHYSIGLEDLHDFSNVNDFIDRVLATSKNDSVNFKGKSDVTGTEKVEFRSAGGSKYLQPDSMNDIKNAAKHYAICLKASYDDTYYQDDYIKLLYRVVRDTNAVNSKDADEHFERIDGYRKGLSEKNKKHPIFVVIRQLVQHQNYPKCVEDMYGSFQYLDEYKKNKNSVESERMKDLFESALLQIFCDVGAKNSSINVSYGNIIKKTMLQFGYKLEKFNLAEIASRHEDVPVYDTKTKNPKEVYNTMLNGMRIINGVRKSEKKSKEFALNIPKGYRVYIKNDLWNELTTERKVKNPDDFVFPTIFANKTKTILMVNEYHVRLAALAVQRVIPPIKWNDPQQWEVDVIHHINKKFKKIYDTTLYGLIEYEGSDYHCIYGTNYQRRFGMIADFVDIRVVEPPSEPLLSAEDISGPDGTPFDPAERVSWSLKNKKHKKMESVISRRPSMFSLRRHLFEMERL